MLISPRRAAQTCTAPNRRSFRHGGVPGRWPFGLLAALMACFMFAGAAEAQQAQGKPAWLNQIEWDFLKDRATIRIAPDPDFPPVEEIDAQGNYRGIAADYVSLVEAKLGIRFTVVKLKTWDAVLEAARERRVDLLPAASSTPQRQEYLLFSSPHLVLPGAIIVRNDVRDDLDLTRLYGKRVAIVSGYVWQELIRTGHPEIQIVPVPNMAAALRMVSLGEAYATIEALPIVVDAIKTNAIGNLRVAGETGFFTRLSFATRKDWPLLSSVIEKTLAQITPAEREAITNKWIRLEAQAGFPWREVWHALLAAIALAVLLAAIAAIWIRSLRHQVRLRTETLARQTIQLRDSEERLRDYAEAASDWFWEMDEHLSLTYLSPNFTIVTGIDVKRLLGVPCYDMIAKPVGKVTMEEHRAAMEQRLPYRDFEFQLAIPDRELFVLSSGKPIFDDAGKFLGYRGTSIDISERRRMQAAVAVAEGRAQQAQKMEAIGQMTGGIAHDFNNLLQAILGNVDFLEAANEPGSKSYLAAQQIRLAGERAARLTKHLLAFARRQPLQPAPMQLDEVVDALRPLLQRVLGETIQLRCDLPAAPITVLADRAQLESALVNLALNSRDAMPNGGVFIISIDTAAAKPPGVPPDNMTGEAFARLRVTDTGVGMTTDVLQKAFDPFFTTKEFGKGSGLGLSMVFGFAKQSGGHAELDSALGRGTTVTILLPQTAEAAPVEPPPQVMEVPTAVAPATVLVVEDDALVRTQVVFAIETLGYKVVAVGSAPAALVQLNGAGPIDLLFTDVVMPGGMNGRELATAARAMRPGLRVLFTSGYADHALTPEDQLGGSVRMLAKPYRHADLARALHDALADRTALAERRVSVG